VRPDLGPLLALLALLMLVFLVMWLSGAFRRS
jgi:hypothetical protein